MNEAPECLGFCQDSEPIHVAFGLSYANYLVLPRTLLQSMPVEWQSRFVSLLEEFYQATVEGEHAPGYYVQTAREVEIADLTDSQRSTVLGGDVSRIGDEGENARYFQNGSEADLYERVMLPVRDPVPHYDRGRARVPLADYRLNHRGS